MPPARTIDEAEIARFARQAGKWWDTEGPFAALHRLNPVRLGFIRQHVLGHFACQPSSTVPYSGLAMLDIGCGGGLLSEPLARLGARVTGIDPTKEAIEAARDHASRSGLDIDYRVTAAEELATAGERYDAVFAMEVVEHVPDVPAFVATAGALVRPGGLLFAATINRTLKAFALAIVGAEYVLRWVPRGTHRWEKFVTPEELQDALAAAGLAPLSTTGVVYDPFGGGWRLGADTDVNYMLVAEKQT